VLESFTLEKAVMSFDNLFDIRGIKAILGLDLDLAGNASVSTCQPCEKYLYKKCATLDHVSPDGIYPPELLKLE